MCADQAPLMRIATALADGERVDWNQAESSAASSEEHRLIEQLRVLAKLAAVHRASAAADDHQASEPSPDSLQPDLSSWGPLELRHKIGNGSFGTVYLAWDPALEREVALKVLRKGDKSTAVIQEGRLLAKVRHPNVVEVYGVDQLDGAVGLWMELVQGQTLKQVLETHGVLGAHEAAVIGIDVCRAVSAVHKAGLLHRDIKVQNVMREAGGRIVLMDFGAGSVRADENGSSRRMIGTPLYLAPELFNGAPASIASDVYSLGVLLYHLVTMRYPVEGDSIDAVAAAHSRGGRTLVTDVRPDLPGGFVLVIERALEPEPARRYRSVGAMQQDLVTTLEITDAIDQRGRHVSAANRPATQSVAVLPFVNLGPEPDIEYFCNGLAEELLTALGKVPGLRVASRSSSFAVKHTGVDAKSICRELDVNAVLEGTVRKAGDRLRITAQLVSAEDGCHLWSDGYDQQMADVFAVQDIAQSVVDRLKITLSGFPRRPLVRRHTDNPRAYESYLKGRFYWSRRYHGGLITALQHFKTAIQEDAGYAQAHAGLADAYAFIAFYVLEPPRATFARALDAVQHALSIEPNLPEAHTSLALIHLGNDWNFAEAEREFKQALELDPNQPLPWIYRSWLSVMQGDTATGAAQARTAQEMEPLSPLVNSGVAYTLFMSRRYAEAVAECDKALEVDPNFIVAIYVKSMSRAKQSRLPEAIELIERAVSMSGRAPFYLGILGNCYGRIGAIDKAYAVLQELDELSKRRYVTPHSQSYTYAGMNDLDRAFEWQARSFEDGSAPFPYYSPMIENLHSDPRHEAELRRMRLQT
jgi:eukaryotic-like serine/threonine-protein kinase